MRDDQLQPGLRVMVCSTAGEALDHPPLLAVAKVIGLADDVATSVFHDGVPRWWLDVWWGTPEPLPQMYRADEIIGMPAVGLVAEADRPEAVKLVLTMREAEPGNPRLEVWTRWERSGPDFAALLRRFADGFDRGELDRVG